MLECRYLADSKIYPMLQQATLDFLTELAANNNKPWFDEHRKAYEAAKNDFEQTVGNVLEQLVTFEPAFAGLTVKQCIFRIYRDTRFSKDKTPYKIHFGGAFAVDGKRDSGAGYYFHCEPGNKSFAAGGMWMPEGPVLKKIRQEIDYNFDRFEAIIHQPEFNKRFPAIEGDRLVKLPQGYTADNPAIEYLKLKSFTVSEPIADPVLTSKKLVSQLVESFQTMKPLLDFLREASS